MSAADEVEDNKQPLMAHLRELRQRLMYAVGAFLIAFAVSLVFADEIYEFLARPLMKELAERGQENVSMIFTALWEGFFTQIKVGFFAGICIAFPVIAWQIWLFVAPGLYKREKKAFLPFLFATPVLFVAGAGMAYYFIFPLAWDFFLDFQSDGEGDGSTIPTVVAPKISEYLSIVMKMIFAFGLSFELPVLLGLMARAGLVSAKGLASKRKYAIVVIVAVAAIITPPDVFSQVGLAIPLYGLFEVSIWIARMIERQREAKEAAFYAELRGEAEAADRGEAPPYDDSDTLGEDATDFNFGRS